MFKLLLRFDFLFFLQLQSGNIKNKISLCSSIMSHLLSTSCEKYTIFILSNFCWIIFFLLLLWKIKFTLVFQSFKNFKCFFQIKVRATNFWWNYNNDRVHFQKGLLLKGFKYHPVQVNDKSTNSLLRFFPINLENDLFVCSVGSQRSIFRGKQIEEASFFFEPSVTTMISNKNREIVWGHFMSR